VRTVSACSRPSARTTMAQTIPWRPAANEVAARGPRIGQTRSGEGRQRANIRSTKRPGRIRRSQRASTRFTSHSPSSAQGDEIVSWSTGRPNSDAPQRPRRAAVLRDQVKARWAFWAGQR